MIATAILVPAMESLEKVTAQITDQLSQNSTDTTFLTAGIIQRCTLKAKMFRGEASAPRTLQSPAATAQFCFFSTLKSEQTLYGSLGSQSLEIKEETPG